MAVPTIVKIPEPMTAPMPREVRLSQPKDFFNRNSAPSQSEISWSMFLRRKSDEATQALRSYPARASDGNGMGYEVREECTARGGCGATEAGPKVTGQFSVMRLTATYRTSLGSIPGQHARNDSPFGVYQKPFSAR